MNALPKWIPKASRARYVKINTTQRLSGSKKAVSFVCCPTESLEGVTQHSCSVPSKPDRHPIPPKTPPAACSDPLVDAIAEFATPNFVWFLSGGGCAVPAVQGPRNQYRGPRSVAQGPDVSRQYPRSKIRGARRVQQGPWTLELGCSIA